VITRITIRLTSSWIPEKANKKPSDLSEGFLYGGNGINLNRSLYRETSLAEVDHDLVFGESRGDLRSTLNGQGDDGNTHEQIPFFSGLLHTVFARVSDLHRLATGRANGAQIDEEIAQHFELFRILIVARHFGDHFLQSTDRIARFIQIRLDSLDAVQHVLDREILPRDRLLSLVRVLRVLHGGSVLAFALLCILSGVGEAASGERGLRGRHLSLSFVWPFCVGRSVCSDRSDRYLLIHHTISVLGCQGCFRNENTDLRDGSKSELTQCDRSVLCNNCAPCRFCHCVKRSRWDHLCPNTQSAVVLQFLQPNRK
jgi:hypothetical protein